MRGAFNRGEDMMVGVMATTSKGTGTGRVKGEFGVALPKVP